MTSNTENLNVCTTSGTVNNVSKSKKKRMKRKQAKAQGADDASSASSLPSLSDNVCETAAVARFGTKLNPIDKLRMDLAGKGYSLSEIEAAMSEMWDSNLPYDSFEDVLVFLKKSSSKKQHAVAALVDTAAATTIKPYTTATKTDVLKVVHDTGLIVQDGTDSVSVPMTESYDSMIPTLVKKDQEGVAFDADLPPATAAAASHTAETTTHLTTNNNSITQNIKDVVVAPPLDLVTKLQLVANYESLHDSIFAISQWASHAKVSELVIVSTESLILSTFLRRCILECTESEYGKIFPYFFNLLCILNPPQRISLTKSAYRDSMIKILTAARKAVAVFNEIQEEEVESKNVGDRIASTVSKAVLSMVSVPILVDRLNAGVSTVKATSPQHARNNNINGYTSELVRLLQQRDVYKTMASHASIATKFSIAATAGDDDFDEHKVVHQQSSLFNEHDADLNKFFVDTKVEHDSLLSKSDVVEARYTDEHRAAESELESCRHQKQSVCLQKADLLRQLQLIEDEETNLSAKEQTIVNHLQTISSVFQAEKDVIENQLEKPKKVMKLTRACRGLENIYISFQKSLASSEVLSKVTSNGHSNGSKAVNKAEKCVADFYTAMRNYFQLESECVDALKERTASMSKTLGNIENEISECRKLGLKTNVLQLERSLGEITQYVSEENNAVEHLFKEVLRMKNELVSLTRRVAEDQPTHIMPHRSLLKDIEAALISLTIPCDDLSELIPAAADPTDKMVDLLDLPTEDLDAEEEEPQHSFELNKCEPSSDVAEDVVTTIADLTPVIETKTTPVATAVPKFSWASKFSVPSQKAEVKSLIQIQEEEKNARNS